MFTLQVYHLTFISGSRGHDGEARGKKYAMLFQHWLRETSGYFGVSTFLSLTPTMDTFKQTSGQFPAMFGNLKFLNVNKSEVCRNVLFKHLSWRMCS